MIKHITTFSILAAFGIGLSGCGGNGNGGVVLTPGPPGSPTTQYIQIERLSRPAIKEVFEPFQHHQISNAVEPYNDPTIQGDIVGTENALRPSTATTNYGTKLASILYPDEYFVNLGGAAPAGADPYYFLSADLDPTKFGGRAPNDDVIYLELGALFGGLLPTLGLIADDNQENNCMSSQNIAGPRLPGGQNPSKLASNTFPYLAQPH